MAQVDLNITYVLQLSPEEFRLVGLALCGKLKGPDMAAAKKLNVRLMELRVAQLGQLQQVGTGALDKARSEQAPGDAKTPQERDS